MSAPMLPAKQFFCPTDDSEQFVAVMDNTYMQIASCVNKRLIGQFSATITDTGGSFTYGNSQIGLFSCSLQGILPTSGSSVALDTSISSAAVFFNICGAVSVGGVVYQLPFYSGTEYIYVTFTGSSLTINYSAQFVGASYNVNLFFGYLR